MTDQITDLTELAEAPAAGDWFVVVDVSDTSMAASGTDKKLTFASMFTAASGSTDPLLTLVGGSGNTFCTISPLDSPSEIGGLIQILGVNDGDKSNIVANAYDAGATFVKQADWTAYTESDSGNEWSLFEAKCLISADGLSHDGRLDLETEDGFWHTRLTTAAITTTIKGQTGQTAALLDLQDSSNVSIFAVTAEGKVGGVAPSVGDSIKWDGTKWAASP